MIHRIQLLPGQTLRLLHQSGRQAADRWLARDPDDAMPMREDRSEPREAWGPTPDTLEVL